MQFAYTYRILLPLLALVVALVLIGRVLHRRSSPIAMTFVILMSSLAMWSLAVVLEHASEGLPAKVFFIKLSYLGIVVLPAAWLVLTLQYSHRDKWVTRRNLALLAIMPVITLFMVWTNDTFHLMWKDIYLDTSYSPPVDAVVHNLGFWVQAGYSYLLILLGTLALLSVFLHSSGIYRRQVAVMLVASMAPWVANFLYIAAIGPMSAVDPTPLAFAISGAAFFWGLFRLQLLDIMPVAHESIFNNMADGVVVVDTRGRIVELNPAAQSMTGCNRANVIGRSYHEEMPAPMGEILLDGGERERDSQSLISLGEGLTVRHYRMDISPITTRGEFNGHLVLLHDATARVKTEAESRERLRLETELAERLREEQILKASEARFRNLVENAAVGIIVNLPDGRILNANRAILETFGYDSEDDIKRTTTVQLYVNRDDRLRMLELVQERGVAKGFEAQMRRKDGATLWASLNVITQVAESGETQYLSLVEDISDRRNAEDELAASRENLRLLAQRVEQAREDERTTIARDLHDRVGQTLTALKFDLDRLQRTLVEPPPEVCSLLNGMLMLVDDGADDVRRISSELRPGALDDLGLAGAIDWQLDLIRERSGVSFSFDWNDQECSLDTARSTALFRVFQELVTNVVRHARATSVNVFLKREDGSCILTVVDDGCGIDERKIADRTSLGIAGMRERLLPYGGELHITGVPGKGTTARVVMPSG